MKFPKKEINLRYDKKILNLVQDKCPQEVSYLCYRGSIVSGMGREGVSDIDFIGFFFPSKYSLMGLDKIQQYEIKEGNYDGVLYDIRKFFQLCLKANPSILESLWVSDEYIIFTDSVGLQFRDLRRLFLTKKCYHTYYGYSMSQLKKLHSIGCKGEKKKKEIEAYGYSVSYSYHLLRLINCGIEVLSKGKLSVKNRNLMPFYKRVRDGEFGVSDIEKIARENLKLLREAYKQSSLPDEPDIEDLKKTMFDILFDHYFYL